jgi:hypothetical protein
MITHDKLCDKFAEFKIILIRLKYLVHGTTTELFIWLFINEDHDTLTQP